MTVSENNNEGLVIPELGAKQGWATSPKEFLFNYIRYIPLLVGAVGLFLVLAYLKIRYAPKIYRVQSSMLIKNDRNTSGAGSNDEKFEDLFMTGGTANLGNEIEVLKSRPVLQRVGKDLHLQTQYYNKGNVISSLLYPNSPFVLDILSMADSSRSFGFDITLVAGDKFLLNENKTPYVFGQPFEIGGNRVRLVKSLVVDPRAFVSGKFQIGWLSMDDLGESLGGGLRIAQINEQTTILTLSMECENTSLGNDILNKLMQVYDTLVVEDKNRIAGNTLRFINDRLFDLSDTLRGVEGGMAKFRKDNEVFDIEGQSRSFMDNLGAAAKQRSELEVKKGILSFLLTYISDKKNEYELVPTVLGIEEPALLQLMAEYNKLQLERDANLKTTSANAPLIISMTSGLEKMRQNIYQALLNVQQAYNIGIENLDKNDEQLHSRLSSLPEKSMQFLSRERRQKILNDLYSLLLQKKLEISMASASTISNSKILETAIGSGISVSPDTKKIYTFYLALGLLIPIGFIALREFLQDKVRGRVDLEKNTSTPIIGEICHSEDSLSLVVKNNSRSLISEQFRMIRTNLQYVVKNAGKPVILVTSSFSGEGKSFVSTNMGAVMALSGKKTVIMEFDIRKPKIVSGLEIKRKMGITNYIIGKATFQELLIKVGDTDNLYVIPCGPIPPNPAELLLDQRLDELMQEVMDNFEIVIMDTAPIGLVSDATNLARFANTCLYIVREGYTFRKQLGLVEEMYKKKQLPGLCLVLNDVKKGGGYYGGYYGGSYGYYGGAYGYGNSSGYFEDESGSKKGRKGKKGLSGFIKRIFG
jgi:tyrosine-protein kinase Etk/Wzc